jgi:hypothetical protein
MKSRMGGILLFALAFTAGTKVATPVHAPAQTASRNIVFILSDDHRYDAAGYMGHPFLETPHLDTLARNGVRFPNAFVTTSLCSPSRASILTGLYAHRHGVVDNINPARARAGLFPGAAAARRLRDGILREVAHGRRERRATARVRQMGQFSRTRRILARSSRHEPGRQAPAPRT